MIDWTELVNFSAGLSGLIISSFGLITSIISRPIERWKRRFFIAIFSVVFVYAASISLDSYAILNHLASLIKPLIFMESLTSSLLLPLLTVYMLRLCTDKWWKSPLFITVFLLWAAYFVLLVYTQFSTVIYSVSPEGVYSRGPLYPLLLVSPAAILLLDLVGLFRRRNMMSVKQFRAIFIYIAAPLAAMIIQMCFYYGLVMVYFGSIIGVYIMSVFILSEQTNLAIRQARENAEKDYGLKVLQMRPHFIYNVMTSIYYLVDNDPQAAKDAIRTFTRYLHHNFSAVVKTENVPFQEELMHTQAYLAIEKIRFGDRLDVTYDTPNTAFSLPPLTLQPIVENAVKHGMDPDHDTLHILIRTRVAKDGNEISVINDGAVFRLAESDSDGIGLKNVTERLALMCGGTLHITPLDGGGTNVTLLIPFSLPGPGNKHQQGIV